MDFEDNGDYAETSGQNDSGMMPLFNMPAEGEEISMNNFTGSSRIPAARPGQSTLDPLAVLEEPQERDVLELLSLMDTFEPIVNI